MKNLYVSSIQYFYKHYNQTIQRERHKHAPFIFFQNFLNSACMHVCSKINENNKTLLRNTNLATCFGTQAINCVVKESVRVCVTLLLSGSVINLNERIPHIVTRCYSNFRILVILESYIWNFCLLTQNVRSQIILYISIVR